MVSSVFHIHSVESKKDIRFFNELPLSINKDDSRFIPHLNIDIEKIFNADKNSQFKTGNARRWVLFEGSECIGKVAAFYNADHHWAGIGFFDCINNQNAADVLFQTAENWLKEHGYRTAEAPVNFGERDKYWGLLVETKSNQSYQENYNPTYYQSLFESAGYQKKFEQTTSETNPERIDYDKFSSHSNKVVSSAVFELEHLKKSNLEKYAQDFVEIYNSAWKTLEHYTPLTVNRVLSLFKAMKPILREDLIWFTYTENRPVAFYVSIIDVNQIFKHLNGKMNLWAKLKFLYYKKRVKISRIRGIVFGVIPEYQNRGLYSGMIMKICEVFQKDPYLRSTELSWIGDFNPKMHALLKSLGATTTKIHYTYEKAF